MDRPPSPSLWRTCYRCKKTKSTLEFNRSNRGSFWTKNCTPCCAYNSKAVGTYVRTDAGKQTQARHQQTDKRKISKARHKTTERYAETVEAYAPRKKELRDAEYERIHSDPGLNLMHGIGCKIGQMLNGARIESKTVMEHSEFANAEDVKAHLITTFTGGMSLENQGKHRVGGPRVWNVGHRIARFHYDASKPEDVRRCWMKQNLFAQWAAENLSEKVKFPKESKLLALRDSWPTAWNDELPSQSERVCMERAVFAMCGKYVRG